MIFAESRDLNNLDNQRWFGDSRGFQLGITEVSTRKIFLTQNHQVLTKTKFL